MGLPVTGHPAGEGVGFQHIRRITGWLSHSLDTWNDAKLAELADRVPHSLEGLYPPMAQARRAGPAEELLSNEKAAEHEQK